MHGWSVRALAPGAPQAQPGLVMSHVWCLALGCAVERSGDTTERRDTRGESGAACLLAASVRAGRACHAMQRVRGLRARLFAFSLPRKLQTGSLCEQANSV